VPFGDLSRQHAPLREAMAAAIADVVATGAFCLGPAVERFEREWAEYCGATYAVGVQSGTAALMGAFAALGVGPGDEVIAPAHTFVATVNAIHFLGATPVLCDIERGTYGMSPAALERAITPRTRAIVPVHLYGQPADMDAIGRIAAARHIPLVEDASQAHGARVAGRRAGTIGALGCFSFYPGKNLGAAGEAGAVITDDEALADAVRRFRNHGGLRRYEHDVPGLNARMEGIQGAVLSCKLPSLERWNAERRAIAAQYTSAWRDLPLGTPLEAAGRDHVYHLYVVETDQRDRLRSALAARGIDALVHYPAPVHLLPAYRHLGYGAGRFPEAERAARSVLSLPLFPGMTPAEIDAVVDAVRAECPVPGRP